MLGVGGALLLTTPAAAAVPINGTVFLDYGGDGVYNSSVDTLLGDVTVTAYDSAGNMVGTAKTTVNASAGTGNYTLSATTNAGEPLRIEFTDLPAGMHDTFMTNAGQTGVQFVTPAASGTQVDYGVFDANQYSPILTGNAANPTLATAIMVAGARTNNAVSNEPVLVGTRWNVTGNVTGRDGRYSATGAGANASLNTQAVPSAHGTIGSPWLQRTTWATYNEVGSIYSLAADSSTNSIYAAAAYKRLSALGPQGLGGIYVVEGAIANDGAPKTRTALRGFNVESLGVDVGSSTLVDQSSRGLATPNTLLNDNDPFQKAGKVGIGGIAVDADARVLYMVNLFDKKIYAIDISTSTPSLIGSVDSPAGENQQAFALTIYQGQLFVGWNDTGSTAFQPAGSDMKYYVARTPLLEEDSAAFGSWETVLNSGNLGYTKGNPAAGWGGDNGIGQGLATGNPKITRWNTWTDSWGTAGGGDASVGIASGLLNTYSPWGNVHIYPQPLLSGIAFDRDGFMTLGIMDRSQLQSGNQNCPAAGTCNTNSALWQTLASGDVLLAAPVRSVDNSTIASWSPENNGTASGSLSRTGTNRSTSSNPTQGEGPGGREFFDDRQAILGAHQGNHREITLGAVAIVPGTSNEVVSTGYDTLEPVRASGLVWFNLQNGNRARGYHHTWDPGDPAFNGTRTSFQKGGGMGGLALLAKAAPVEIGNRAWLDLNRDGVQDAGEPSIQGAIVELWTADEDGNPIAKVNDGEPNAAGSATKTTDANGNYFFRSENAISGGTTGFKPLEGATEFGNYVVVFKPGDGTVQLGWTGITANGQAPAGFVAPAWGQLEFTEPEADAAEDQDLERGSNALPSGPESNPNAQGNAFVAVGHFGQNDHSIDAGWRVGTVAVGDYVWEDKNHDGRQDSGEPGIKDVLLELYLVDGGTSTRVTTDAFGNAFTKARTDGDGYYEFANLPVLTGTQQYEVRIATADSQTDAALDGFQATRDGVGDREGNSSTGSASTSDATGSLRLDVPGRADNSLDFGFWRPTPDATIVKNDGTNEADTSADAVDLTVTGSAVGTTPLRFKIENTGSEALYDVVVTDKVVEGNATVTDMVCFFDPGVGTDGEYDEASNSWTVTWEDSLAGAGDERKSLAVGSSFECQATLTGVVGAHANSATITGVGAVSGDRITPKPFDPTVPTDPEHPIGPGNPPKPGTDNPFYANRTPAVSVGDRVWFDSNKDGEQAREGDAYDPSEPGIDGVVLEIVGPDGQPVKSVVTGENVPNETTSGGGLYEFKDLPVLDAGQSYTVKVVYVPEQYKPTVSNSGGTGEYDSSTDEADSQLELTDHGAKDMTLDFGFVKKEPTAEVLKTDANGADANTADDAVDLGPAGGSTTIRFSIINDGEEPLTNIRLSDSIESGAGTLGAIMCTAPGGVSFDGSTAWTGTLSNVAGDDADNPQNLITCEAPLTGVAPGETHHDVVTLYADGKLTGDPIDKPTDEFHGKYKTYAIGDYVWVDADGDGIQGDDEDPIAGVEVRLFKIENGSRTQVGDTKQTDADGFYFFDELPAGEYEVEFGLPSGYFWTKTGEGNSTNDSNALWTEEDQEWAATVGIFLDGDNAALDTEYNLQSGWKATEGIDPTWDAGVVKRVPNATIDKSDDSGETANDGGNVVDLGADGATGIVFSITNTGGEPLTNIGLADVTTSGSGELQYPIVLTLPDGVTTFELEDADATWPGSLGRGDTLVGRAQLTGVKAGETHRNEVTLHAEGSLTGDPVLHPNPDDPDGPGVPPTDPFNGRVPSYAIGDYVWLDANRDGIQDADEDPVSGVTVRLLDGTGQPVLDEDGDAITTTTNGDGYYLFDNLVEGSYIVEFVLPDGEYRWTQPNADDADSTDGSDAEFANSNDATARTRVINLGPDSPLTELGEQEGRDFVATEGVDQTWDAGLVLRTYAIGDVVWIDRNEDGKQDDGEPRLEGVVVNLLDGEGNAVLDGDGEPVTTTTDANGRYIFDELLAGKYIVEFELPDGHRWTTQNADGVAPADNSDADTTTGRTGVITLGNSSVDADYTDQPVTATEGIDPTWDAGVVPLKVSVGDYVWHDKDGDGVQNDGDDSGINGVTLTLTVKRADGTEESVTDVWGFPVSEAVTANDGDGNPGYYEFIDLPVLKDGESYIVTITSGVPDKYKPTIIGADEDPALDPAEDSSTGSATSGPLPNDGDSDLTLDFGFVLKTPSGTVTKQDADENDADTPADAVDLGPTAGETTIVFTIENDGEEPLTNIGLVDATTAGNGQVVYPIVLTLPDDSTFELTDATTRWDGELAIGESITGRAQLTGVEVGRQSHTNVVTLWADGALTGRPVADPDDPGDDPENPNRPTDPFNAESLTYAIGDYVWIDRNQDGQQDADETPVAGMTVNLLDGDGNPIAGKTTTTDDDGLYFFDELPAGTYMVEFVLPDGYRFTEQNAAGIADGNNSDANELTGRTGPIVLGPSNTNLNPDYEDQDGWNATEGLDPTWDAGIVPESVSVGDFVWHDLNGDGLQDAGEPGIEKVTLTISGPEGWDGKNVYGEPVTPVETDEFGKYVFKDLPVLKDGESYTVTISNVPPRFEPTIVGADEDPALDPALDSSTGSATSGPLTEDGDDDPTLDFGFVLKTPGATVVKADSEGRDANDADSPVDLSPTGAIEIVFTIVNNGGEAITNIGLVDATTVGSGDVQYPIEVTTSEGQEFTLESAADRWDGELAIGETATGRAQLTGVVAGEPHTNVVTLWADGALTGKPVVDPDDPGTPEDPNRPEDPYNAVVKTYAIGDYVWLDTTPNGVQDDDEDGLAGVTVTLYKVEGDERTEVDSVVTGDDGYYQFDELDPGTYEVTFDVPTGYILVPHNVDDDTTVDSDAIASNPERTSGATIVVTLDDTNTALEPRDGVKATEGIDPTWDAGVRKYTFAIGDVVWIDRNEDGKQDDDEPRIEGVKVNLLDGAGNPVLDSAGEPRSELTDENGLYLFDELPQGDYIVEFELPAGYFWTEANAAGDGVTDENNSDAVHETPTSPKARTGVITLGASNAAVTPDYEDQGFAATVGVDPTWDAGVIPASVSVGDLVWLDQNRDGLQDDDEPGLEDVVLTLTGPDGGPVKNVYGEDVEPITTGPDGKYEFKDLPVLEPDESYTVTVTSVPDKYLPTKPGEGDDRGKDSSTDSEKSGDLTEHGANDPTLDFGFVEKVPSGTVNKSDADENDANTADEAVDLGPAAGSTEIVFTIANNGDEPLTNIGLADVSTGTGTIVYPIVLTLPDDSIYELEDADARWDGVLEIGETITGTAQLDGVEAGRGSHRNVVTLWAEGTITGKPVEDPDNPSDDPQNPNRPEDPYHADYLTYAIGDIVWIDRDQNGQQDNVGQDGGEKPYVGMTVNLLDGDGNAIAGKTTTTDANGRYYFDELPAGDYIVEFVLPSGHKFTEQGASGVTGAANSDAATSNGRTGVITLGEGNGNLDKDYADQDDWSATEGLDPTWDAGIVPESVVVGDKVWFDLNGNGRQDDGEPGIAEGTTLTLTGPDGQPVTNVYGEPVAPVETNTDGSYIFTDLPVLKDGESYTVTISNVPDRFKPTTPGVGDRGGDSSTGSEKTQGLKSDGTEDRTLDFGFVLKDPTATVNKADADGNDANTSADAADLSPTGSTTVKFTITNPANAEEPITNIGLADVSTGSGSIQYPMVCVAPDNSTFELADADARWTVDATPVETRSLPLTEETAEAPAEDATDDETAVEIDVATDEATDEVTEDATNEATEVATDVESDDATEEATDEATDDAVTAEDVVVEVPENTPILRGTPEPSYGVLQPGEQIICEAVLTGVKAGQPHENIVTLWAEGELTGKPVQDPDNPSDDPENPNRPEDPYNAVVKTYAIGDYVWIDQVNPNGVQDDDEPGLAGVTVRLLDADGNPTGKTTTTDSDGFYKFDNLDPGTYQVQFELPRGYVLISPNQGDDDALDSDALPIEGTNNTQGRTITVTLDDTNDQLTKRDGVTATEGIDPTWDAGVRLAEVTVGDFVWKDIDRDGVQDPGEPGIPGVVLVIERSDGKPVTDVDGNPVGPETTDENGEYVFDKLPVLPEGESYVVKIDREASKDALGNFVPTTPGAGNDPGADSSTWEEKATGLEKDGDEDRTLDFGFVEPSVSVGDRVWEDVNQNGVQDSGEPGISGVVLEIVGPDGKPVTDVFGNPVGPVTTDENGNYLFPNLPALKDGESYKVKIDREASKDALTGFEPTKENSGERDKDSSTWQSESQGLTKNGEKDLTLDFGFIRPAVTVGDKVWKDTNRDGRQDPGEPGIPGIVLVITDKDGNPVKDIYGNEVPPQTTDKDGNYEFTNLPVLPEGESYIVSIDREASKDALGNLIPTKSGQGDREGDSSTWNESTKGLNANGDKDLTLDFGFVVPSVSVGDKVWVDENGNGRQDPGEPGIPGVVLEIVGPDGKPVTDVFGKPVGPVTTDKDGNYLFPNLPALEDGQSYKVKIDREASKKALEGYLPTTPGQGDREGDSSTWEAITAGLNKEGDEDLTLDFGFVPQPVDPEPTPDPEAPAPSPTPTPKPETPSTGIGGAWQLGLAALVALGLGAGFIAVARRKQAS